MVFQNPSQNSLEILISMISVEFWIAIGGNQTVFHTWKLTFLTWFFGCPWFRWKLKKTSVDFKDHLPVSLKNHKITLFGFSHIVEFMVSMQIPHQKIHGNFGFFPVLSIITTVSSRFRNVYYDIFHPFRF